MDITDSRPLTKDDFKEFLKLIRLTHKTSYRTVNDTTFDLTVPYIGTYRLYLNKPSLWEFKKPDGEHQYYRQLPYEFVVVRRDAGIREKIVQRILYDMYLYMKECIVKVLV